MAQPNATLIFERTNSFSPLRSACYSRYRKDGVSRIYNNDNERPTETSLKLCQKEYCKSAFMPSRVLQSTWCAGPGCSIYIGHRWLDSSYAVLCVYYLLVVHVNVHVLLCHSVAWDCAMLSALAQARPTMSCIPLHSKYDWIVVLITDLDQIRSSWTSIVLSWIHFL